VLFHPARLARRFAGGERGRDGDIERPQARADWNSQARIGGIMGSLKKLTVACSEAGRVCPPRKYRRHFTFENGYAGIGHRQAIHRANSARTAAANRFRLIAAAVR